MDLFTQMRNDSQLAELMLEGNARASVGHWQEQNGVMEDEWDDDEPTLAIPFETPKTPALRTPRRSQQTPNAPHLTPLAPPPLGFSALRLAPSPTRGIALPPPPPLQLLPPSTASGVPQQAAISFGTATFQSWLEPHNDCVMWEEWETRFDCAARHEAFDHKHQHQHHNPTQMAAFCHRKSCLHPDEFQHLSFGQQDILPAEDSCLSCCSVCIDSIQPHSEIITLPCGHTFHTSCMRDCLKFGTRCPNCRYHLETQAHDHDHTSHLPPHIHHNTNNFGEMGIPLL